MYCSSLQLTRSQPCPFSGSRYFIRTRYLLSVPFWIKTQTHPCTSHPLHSLNITCISMICHFRCCPHLFIYNTCRTSDGSAGACLEQGRVYVMLGRSDPTVASQSVLCSDVFFNHEIYTRRKLWCLRLTVCHFHVQNCYYLTMPR